MNYFYKAKIKTVPTLANKHRHWAVVTKERKQWHKFVCDAFRICLPKEPLKNVEVNCVRFSSRMPDYDNLVYSFKPILDALILAKVIRNDDMITVSKRNYNWVKVPEKDRHVTIEVIEHDPNCIGYICTCKGKK